jgi:hypothetical protein
MVLNDMVESEYPDKWPDLLGKIMGYMTSPDPKIVFGALEALRVTIKRYE